MKAIETRYLPATARKGSRIVASDSDGNRATISYPHELREGEEAHRAAAHALCDKLHWVGPLVGGQTRRGWAFVHNDGNASLIAAGPDLLAACEGAKAVLDREGYFGGVSDRLNAAIAKARSA